MEKQWVEEFKIKFYEVDLNKNLKMKVIFDYLQEIATNHALSLGFGYKDVEKVKCFWVLSRIKVDMDDYPKIGEKIVIKTWIKNENRFFFIRDFVIYHKDKEVGRVTSTWVLLNRETGKPENSNILNVNPPIISQMHGIDESLKRIEKGIEEEFVYNSRVGYNDVDVNGHLNNARYVEWIYRCIDNDENINKKLKAIQINYLAEAKYGETIEMYKENNENNTNIYYIEGRINRINKKVFRAKIVMES